MGKKHKKHKSEWRSYDAGELGSPGDQSQYYVDKPLEKPLKLVLKVGGSEVTELSGSGHDSSFYEDRSDHERERHKEKKKKKKKKSEKEKDKYLDEDERRRRKEEKKRKREKEQCDSEGETEVFESVRKVDIEATDRPVRACRTHPAENESTPLQQLLEYFLRQLQRKDPNGFFAFPVTDQIAPGYFMIIKNPMDFSTMKEKISQNEYKSVTEFKADFKLMCDNAMTYNRPETVYYKLAKKLLHTGFKMMSKERLLALKRSMSFMQDMDFSQQAALLGDEDTTTEEPTPEIIMPTAAEVVKKSKKPSKDMFRVMEEDQSSIFEPEGNACSLTDSTAEEHVLALVEHAADEARDKINRYLPNCRIGYLKKNADGTLIYTVVNGDPENEEDTHLVDLSSLSSKLLPSFTTLGFKEDRRHKVTFLNSTGTALSLQNNTLFTNLKPDQIDLMYAGYGDDTGIQCALSLQEFVKDCGSFAKRMVNDLLDQITGGDHSRTIYQVKQMAGSEREGSSNSVLDYMALKTYSDVSLDMSMLSSLDKVKKELEHEDSHLNLDDASKLLPDFHDVHNDRGGSRPSSSSSVSNNSERDHHLGSPSRISVGEQQDIHDPYEFLQSPETENQN
ncbi:bromodomain-containing protein 9 isoform X2 [Xenopus tropicalis]|uniref:Bromodomain-containing protein 9 n=1 Tax=Xenopus tropicalis TaxID=8364 RepID=A0A8J0SFW0_XENTR|nr:bromodomain-containing protein 9 isoform X2 [Xenopus tropicalis]|eukprot:XP_012819943.1 PREDICTED: bromodomain-containing protein 9 isoform X2 [Xenopus tropicalis]